MVASCSAARASLCDVAQGPESYDGSVLTIEGRLGATGHGFFLRGSCPKGVYITWSDEGRTKEMNRLIGQNLQVTGKMKRLHGDWLLDVTSVSPVR
jgi:hypothetical protein